MRSPYSQTCLLQNSTLCELYILATTGVSKVALIIFQPLTVIEGTSKLSRQTGVAHSTRNTHECRGHIFFIDNDAQV
jgi:hypothetical protein